MGSKFSISGIFQLVDKMSGPISKIEGRLTRFGRTGASSIATLDKKLEKLGHTTKLAKAAMGAAFLGAGFAIHHAGKAGLEFEQAITNVGAVMLKSRGEIGNLEKKAIELGASTQFTASQVAGAMESMARAGFKTEDILSGVGGVLDAAAASGLEMAEVSGIVSNAIKGMGMETSQATRVADVLALASSKTNSTMGSLGEALSNVASTARQVGMPLEDTVAAVALLQDVGLDASVAGSALNTMLTKLAAPTDKVAAKMEQYGVAFKDAQGNMLPFAGVLENISKAAKKSGGNFDQVALFAELVGLRGQKAASNLATLFETGKVKELTKLLQDAEGSAKAMAAIRMSTTLGSWEEFTSAVEGVEISLFGLAGGPLKDTIKGMTKWVTANQALIVSKVQDWIADVADNMADIVKWGTRIAYAVGIFYSLAIAVKVARVAMALFNGVMAIAHAAMWLYSKRTVAAAFANKLFSKSTKSAQLDLFAMNTQTAATGTGLAAMRGALNASKMGGLINGVTSKLGKAGLLGAALGVGYAIGTWLDHEFGISKMLEDWLVKITGINEGVEKAGGRATKRGVGAGGRVYDDGTIIGEDGSIIKKGAEWAKHVPSAQGGLAPTAAAAPAPQVISPQERATHALTETLKESKESVDLTIKDKTGRAELGRHRPKLVRLKLQQSGAG
jgi:TP901 family phage tail tape measure protein